jgi:hypothetical protein
MIAKQNSEIDANPHPANLIDFGLAFAAISKAFTSQRKHFMQLTEQERKLLLRQEFLTRSQMAFVRTHKCYTNNE